MTDFGERRRILPKTGQTIKYRPGDDGDLEHGWNEANRFKDVGDGTIVDNATGLMWPKDWTGKGANYGNKKNWIDAIDWALALNFAGYADWALPNTFELYCLQDAELHTPCFPRIFTVTDNIWIWTSTTDAQDSIYALVVYSSYIYIDVDAKTSPLEVLAVRKA